MGLLALVPRLHGLDVAGFSADELNIVHNSTGGPLQWLAGRKTDPLLKFDPPLSYAIHGLFLSVAVNEFFSRLPEALSGAATVSATYLMGRAALTRTVGLVAAVLVGISGYHLHYSQEGRYYTIFGFFFLLSLASFFQALRSNGTRDWIRFFVASLLAAATNSFTVLVLLVYTGWMLLLTLVRLTPAARWLTLRPTVRSWRSFAACGIGIALLLAPWLAMTFQTEIASFAGTGSNAAASGGLMDSAVRAGQGAIQSASAFAASVVSVLDWTVPLEGAPPGTTYQTTLVEVFKLFSNDVRLYGFFGLVGALTAVRRFRERAIVLITLPLVMVYLISIANKLAHDGFGPRRLLFLIPIEMLLVAIGIVEVSAIAVGIIALVVTLLTSLGQSLSARLPAARTKLSAFPALVSRIDLRAPVAGLSLCVLAAQFVWPVLPGMIQPSQLPRLQDWRGAARFFAAAVQPGERFLYWATPPDYIQFYSKRQDIQIVVLKDRSETVLESALAEPGNKWLVRVEYLNPFQSAFFRRAAPSSIVVPFTQIWVMYIPAQPLSKEQWSAVRLRLLEIAVEGNPIGYEARVELGRAYWERGDAERAVGVLKEAIARAGPWAPWAGEDYQANRLLAQVYWSQGRLEAALQQYQTVLNVYPGAARPYVDIAHVLLELGRAEEAEKISREALAIDLTPMDRAWAYLNLGTIRYGRGDAAGAIATWRQAIDSFPNGPAAEIAHASIGDQLRADGDLAGAEEEYRKALAINQDSVRGHTGMGNVHLARRELASAQKAFERATALDAGAAAALKGLGDVHAQLGNDALALDAFHRAVAAEPDSAWYLVALGDQLRSRNRFAEALPVYERATQARPKLSVTFVGLGDTYRELRRYEEAQDAYLAGLKLDPGNAWAYVGLGNIYLEVDRLENATAAFQNAIQLDAGNAYGYLGLGTVLRKQGNAQDAAAAYEQAVSLKTPSPWAYVALADLYRDRGELDRAAELYQYALTVDGGIPWTYVGLAEIARQRGAHAEARRWYSQALERDPNNSYALSGLAAVQ